MKQTNLTILKNSYWHDFHWKQFKKKKKPNIHFDHFIKYVSGVDVNLLVGILVYNELLSPNG